MRYRTASALLTAAILTVPTYAASTKFKTTWKSPDAATVDLRGQKVVALVIRNEDAPRQDAEVALAKALTARGLQGIPAYSIIPASEIRNREAAKARLEALGIAAVVVMKEVGQSSEVTESPATFYATATYNTFWGYYDSGWSYMYEPSYLNIDRIICVETLIYDLRRDKLVWAGMSDSTNPKMVTKLIQDLVDTTAKELKKQGLVRPRK
jgi:hypothetical protein